MNRRRRGTREESHKRALDSAWSMGMSKLTRDGTAEPVSRDQILRRERGKRIIHFPCSAADHEQDWQPCPVVRAIPCKHSSTYTYRCSSSKRTLGSLEVSLCQKEKSVRPVMTQRRREPRTFFSRTPAAREAVPSPTSYDCRRPQQV